MGLGGLRGSGPPALVMLRPGGAGARGTTHLQRMRELGAGGARSSFQLSAPSLRPPGELRRQPRQGTAVASRVRSPRDAAFPQGRSPRARCSEARPRR